MITFYRKDDCPSCDAIQESIEDLCLKHQLIFVDKNGPQRKPVPDGTRPPVLVDDDQVFEGAEDIMNHMEQLGAFVEEWNRFQSDACYCR